ncbi:MAG: plastocyanin/azurin family copper-binding protein [Thermoleophilaceae bacterium]
MIRLGTTAATCLCVAAVASGCGSSGSDSGGGSSSGSGSGPPSIGMKDLRFHPASLSVKVGQKVTWKNEDTVDHNVTAKSGAKFMSQAFGGGGSYSYTPRSAGTIKYVCTLHPGMDGTVVVRK